MLDPEDEALLADSVGLALQIVIDTLAPAERLAFVLHDLFGIPFDEIGPMVDRTPQAARQLASRARRRIKGAETPAPDRDVRRQRAVVDAFFVAGRAGDFDALVVRARPRRRPPGRLRARPAGPVDRRPRRRRGRRAGPAGRAVGGTLHPALVNGAAGVVVTARGRPVVVMGFTVAAGQIVEIDAIADPRRVRRVAAAVLDDEGTVRISRG